MKDGEKEYECFGGCKIPIYCRVIVPFGCSHPSKCIYGIAKAKWERTPSGISPQTKSTEEKGEEKMSEYVCTGCPEKCCIKLNFIPGYCPKTGEANKHSWIRRYEEHEEEPNPDFGKNKGDGK